MTGRGFDEAPYRTGYIDADLVSRCGSYCHRRLRHASPCALGDLDHGPGPGRTEGPCPFFGMIPRRRGRRRRRMEQCPCGECVAITAGIYVLEDRLTEGLFLLATHRREHHDRGDGRLRLITSGFVDK